MMLTGLVFPSFDNLVVLAIIAFVGTINPSAGDIGMLVPVEHAMLARGVSDKRRTHAFARYSLIGALATAGGALAAATPDLLVPWGIDRLVAFKGLFYFYAALGSVAMMLYWKLPHAKTDPTLLNPIPLGPSRGIVYKLAALFSLDAFAGGFAVQSLLALWLFERFDISLSEAGLFFFWSNTLSAFSFPVAAWLSQRIGLVNTMVFTHIPSSLCLILAAFASDLTCRARPFADTRGSVSNGCTHAHILRDGRGNSGRTHRSCERHRCAAESGFLSQSSLGRTAPREFLFRVAACALWSAQDCLRSGAPGIVSSHQAPGGTP